MAVTRNDNLDVETIMARIRENVRQKHARDMEFRHGSPSDPSARGGVSALSGALNHYVHLLRRHQDPKPQGAIAPHGSMLVRRMKAFIQRVMVPYHRAIFARQAEFNANVVHATLELASMAQKAGDKYVAVLQEVHGIIEPLRTLLDQQIAQTGTQFAEVTARHGELSRRSEEMHSRSEEMRQVMILQKRRLELILSELRKKIGDERESLAKVASQKDRLMDHAYFLFENQYRLSRDVIKKRQEIYMSIFREGHASLAGRDPNAPPVILDLGCGRGEFLELLRETGLPGKGIDLNEDMVHVCQERGLDVEQANFFDYLQTQPDGSLGGILACQVIEHLSVEDMIEFVKLCHQKLQKGARAVFETVNPLSLVVSATNFYMDLSHIRQVHPTALQFLAEAIGFSNTEVKFLSPFSDESTLQLVTGDDLTSQQINDNFRRLNDILFGYQDYALICRK